MLPGLPNIPNMQLVSNAYILLHSNVRDSQYFSRSVMPSWSKKNVLLLQVGSPFLALVRKNNFLSTFVIDRMVLVIIVHLLFLDDKKGSAAGLLRLTTGMGGWLLDWLNVGVELLGGGGEGERLAIRFAGTAEPEGRCDELAAVVVVVVDLL